MTAASGGDGEVAGVHASRRRQQSGATVNWGDGGEGEGFGEEVVAGGPVGREPLFK